MSVIYPQISKPGGFGMGLCAGRYSWGYSSYTHLFLYVPTLTKSSFPPLPPHRHPSAWMYSTSRSSICFCPPMKRSIIICRMHSWRAASFAVANQDSASKLGHESKGPGPLPRRHFIYVGSLTEIFSWTSFYNNIVSIIPFSYKSVQSE